MERGVEYRQAACIVHDDKAKIMEDNEDEEEDRERYIEDKVAKQVDRNVYVEAVLV